MKKVKMIVPFLAVAVAVCLVAGYGITTNAKEDDKIADKVTIGGLDVGGMNVQEASEVVEAYVEEAMDTAFILEAGDNSVEVTAEELGITWSNTNVVEEAVNLGKVGNLIQRYKDNKDLENAGKNLAIKYEIDADAVTELLEENADTLNTEVINNGLIREDDEFVFVEGQSGVEVSIDESITAIQNYLNSSWDGTDAAIDLVAVVVEPEGDEEELAKVQDVLGSYSTNFSTSSSARCANIEVAAGRINGTVLYPGEEFSASGTMGERDAANGYELAGAYENGQTVEAYGGGVCQVSTTLYNAVILAELEVTERSNHSMIVSYVDPSRDAAIAGDYKDLKFENNTDAPIYIEAYTSGKNLYFNIYGEETRASNRKVEYVSEVISQEDPAVEFVVTADPLGTINVEQSAHIGYHARLWKVVYIDGVIESKEQVNSSVYKPSSKIIDIGLGTDNAEAINAINAAIETGDENVVRATVEQYVAAATVTTTVPTPTPEEQAITSETTPVVPSTETTTPVETTPTTEEPSSETTTVPNNTTVQTQ